jgi:hypothetical protein
MVAVSKPTPAGDSPIVMLRSRSVQRVDDNARHAAGIVDAAALLYMIESEIPKRERGTR